MKQFFHNKGVKKILASLILLSLTFCSISKIYASDTPSKEIKYTQGVTGKVPALGEVIADFTVTEIGNIDVLDADTIKFVHKKTGAELLYIKNDDKNLGFSIGYLTPNVDETDMNHIFEHAIIASSKKYPSKDIFFDVANKSYNTFINAFTNTTYTVYPITSQSEDQLMKMADVYLSCMVDPDVIHNENFFRREAIRYELVSTSSEIEMKGTVFNEDYGYSTSIPRNMYHAVMHTLFGDTYNANCIGRLATNYKDLTYEKTKQTYYRNYHFDNSLMLLYGDLDYVKFLKFINDEYLKNEVRNNTNIGMYFAAPVPEGHIREERKLPVTNDFDPKDASIISCAFVVDDFDAKDMVTFNIVSAVLNNAQSKFQKRVKDRGLTGSVSVGIENAAIKKFLSFDLENTNKEDADEFEKIVNETLDEMSKDGVDAGALDGVLTSVRISDGLKRESSNVFVDVIDDIYAYWCGNGRKTDFYSDRRLVIDEIRNDKNQKRIKELAKRIIESKRSALVIGIPEPGLSEAEDEIRNAYLKNIYSKMSEDDKLALVEVTKRYKQWEEEEISNSDFTISPKEVEDFHFDTELNKEKLGDKLIYTKAVHSTDIVGIELIFDITNLKPEDRYYYTLMKILLGNIPTFDKDEDEISVLKNKYLFSLNTSNMFYDESSTSLNHPALSLSFFTLEENLDKSLEFLNELIYKTGYNNTPKISKFIDMKLPNYNLGQYGDGAIIGETFANAKYKLNSAMDIKLEDQGFYDWLYDMRKSFDKYYSSGEELFTKMKSLTTSIFNPENLIIIAIGRSEKLPEIKDKLVDFADKKLISYSEDNAAKGSNSNNKDELYKQNLATWKEFLHTPNTVGVITSSPNQHIRIKTKVSEDKMPFAKIEPFIYALSDKYFIPKIRFSGTAYSGGARGKIDDNIMSIYSYYDTEGLNTINVIKDVEKIFDNFKISKEELDGYILNALSSEIVPEGKFSGAYKSILRDIKRMDLRKIESEINSIKETTLSDMNNALESIKDALSNMTIALVGSKKKVSEASEVLAEIYDWTQSK